VRGSITDPNLLVGLDAPDDAAVYLVSQEVAIVQTVDFFTPVVDDPRAWGRIAAANSLSDVYAMGARPMIAMNIVGWPRALDFELLGAVLEGGEEACSQAGVSIVGGHSIDDTDPKYGLAVTGTLHPDRIILKSGAPPGNDLVLTKPLGVGIVSSAIKEQRAPEEVVSAAIRVMTTLNKAAAEAMVETGVAAATDVTGFGLIGHLLQMLDAGVGAELRFESIPILPGALELARLGIMPGGTRRNMEAMGDRVTTDALDDAERALLFDAQTSGGLLMACSPDRSEALLRAVRARGAEAHHVGCLVTGDQTIEVV
jgi:selenide, water dikinase